MMKRIPRKNKKELVKIEVGMIRPPKFKKGETHTIFSQEYIVRLKGKVKSNKWTRRTIRELHRELKNRYKNIIMKELSSDFSKIVEENFWDLI